MGVLVRSLLLAGYVVFTLHVTTANSHPVHRCRADNTLMPESGHCLPHLLCCDDDDDDDDDFLLMGLVYQMPSTIMCTYQSYHEDRPEQLIVFRFSWNKS